MSIAISPKYRRVVAGRQGCQGSNFKGTAASDQVARKHPPGALFAADVNLAGESIDNIPQVLPTIQDCFRYFRWNFYGRGTPKAPGSSRIARIDPSAQKDQAALWKRFYVQSSLETYEKIGCDSLGVQLRAEALDPTAGSAHQVSVADRRVSHVRFDFAGY